MNNKLLIGTLSFLFVFYNMGYYDAQYVGMRLHVRPSSTIKKFKGKEIKEYVGEMIVLCSTIKTCEFNLKVIKDYVV